MTRSILRWRLGFLVVAMLLRATAHAEQPKISISNGDRVALVGSAFLERELRAGRIETVLTLLNPGVAFQLRNFSWSGDTVWGDSRAEFDTAKEGYARLLSHVAEFKPTLIIVGYGLNESFKGQAGLADFRTGLKRVLDDLTKDGARLALISPPPLERLAPPLPDVAEANRNLKLYIDAASAEAAERKVPYIDIFTPSGSAEAGGKAAQLTDDGVHMTDYGYWRMADEIARAAKLKRAQAEIKANFKDGSFTGEDVEFEKLATKEEVPKHFRFKARLQALPYPASPAPHPADVEENRLASRRIAAQGLAPGTYRLEIDGKEVAKADAAQWAAGVDVRGGPETEQVEALRRAIVRKNELFFYRWRPQNDTYLFLFRKHEQGQNAVEIPKFDPLVAEQDEKVARLAKPEFHVYEFIPVAEAAK